MALIKRGLLGTLKTPEERAQYYLLLCQPRQAWGQAEQISDVQTKQLYEGLILALVSSPAPDQSNRLKSTRPDSDLRFQLDAAEVWRDELDDVDLPASCAFPTVAADKLEKIRAQALKTLQPVLSQTESFSALAIATDVGFVPELQESDLLGKQIPPSYIGRFQYFAKRAGRRNPEIQISGMSASVSNFGFSIVEMTPHELEIPWLLR
jgi:hypothetical protein